MNEKLEKLSEDILEEFKTLNRKTNDINNSIIAMTNNLADHKKEIIDILNKILKNQETLLKDKIKEEEEEEPNYSIPVPESLKI